MKKLLVVSCSCLVFAASGCGSVAGSAFRSGRQARQQEHNADMARAKKNADKKQQEEAAAKQAEYAAQEVENEKVREDLRTEAKKLGFEGVDFDTGLVDTLFAIMRGDTTMKDAGRSLIALQSSDHDLTVFQVIDQNNVLFRGGNLESVVWLRNYKKKGGEATWLEGSLLKSMEWGYVAIKGTKTYSTLLGSKQAVIVEPIF